MVGLLKAKEILYFPSKEASSHKSFLVKLFFSVFSYSTLPKS